MSYISLKNKTDFDILITQRYFICYPLGVNSVSKLYLLLTKLLNIASNKTLPVVTNENMAFCVLIVKIHFLFYSVLEKYPTSTKFGKKKANLSKWYMIYFPSR